MGLLKHYIDQWDQYPEIAALLWFVTGPTVVFLVSYSTGRDIEPSELFVIGLSISMIGFICTAMVALSKIHNDKIRNARRKM